MTLEFILRAAVRSIETGSKRPHCFSAHVPGEGYVNEGNLESDRAEYVRQATHAAQSEVDNIGYASDYAEPGYVTPAKGIVLANWNAFPSKLTDILESAGYAIEWSDEWSTCDDCGRIVRTSGDSYHWTPAYALINECSIVCHDCLADNPDDYLEELSGNENACLTEALARVIDVTDHGYTLHNPEHFESGFHPGQNDNPREIAKRLRAAGIEDFIFVQTEQSQFYVKFDVYVKREEPNLITCAHCGCAIEDTEVCNCEFSNPRKDS